MEKRLLAAIGLMIALMVLSNVIFPPIPAPETPGDSLAVAAADSLAPVDSAGATASDSPAMATGTDPATGPGAGGDEPAAVQEDTAAAEELARQLVQEAEDPQAALEAAGDAPDPESAGELVIVRSGLYEYRFSTNGARLVGATLFAYENFAPDAPADGTADRVELIRPGDALLGYEVSSGGSSLPLEGVRFEPSADSLVVTDDEAELRFNARVGQLAFTVTYRFQPDGYRVGVDGALEGLRDRGYTVAMSLGRGLESNEANPSEDESQMALVTHDRDGSLSTEDLDDLDPGEERVAEGGPFGWVASKSKYFLAALIAPENGPGFGGVVLTGVDEPVAADMRVSLPVPGGSDGFEVIGYFGPQDHDRLRAIGQSLHNVNPFGWRFLQWFIRPFGGLVIDVLVWMHNAFSLAYGWVLILFGVLTRIVLFPLYQKSMRQQMKQMAIQPEIKRIQEKHKEDPQKLQQEMMKIYKEAGVNPLGGCLPMLVPFPILITLFFVFQNTIEFRGVPFLWLPDLSLKDPIYVVPLLMGGSMLLLNWIGQRGMETNQQMKMFTYVLPVVFTFMFAQFAAGLNLYYAASNIASLPQQMYLSKERRAARAQMGGAGGKNGKKKPPDD